MLKSILISALAVVVAAGIGAGVYFSTRSDDDNAGGNVEDSSSSSSSSTTGGVVPVLNTSMTIQPQ